MLYVVSLGVQVRAKSHIRETLHSRQNISNIPFHPFNFKQKQMKIAPLRTSVEAKANSTIMAVSWSMKVPFAQL